MSVNEDTRIAYGARCTWWDGIKKVGSRGSGPLGRLPCCPKCGQMLFEVDSPKAWWSGVDQHASTHPGYRDFIEWMRGRCFPDIKAAQRAYEQKPGRTVML